MVPAMNLDKELIERILHRVGDPVDAAAAFTFQWQDEHGPGRWDQRASLQVETIRAFLGTCSDAVRRLPGRLPLFVRGGVSAAARLRATHTNVIDVPPGSRSQASVSLSVASRPYGFVEVLRFGSVEPLAPMNPEKPVSFRHLRAGEHLLTRDSRFTDATPHISSVALLTNEEHDELEWLGWRRMLNGRSPGWYPP